MAPQKVLHLCVEMCCQNCVDEVEGVFHETHGVADFKIERYNSLVIVKRKPDTTLDKKRLLKRLARVTHEGKPFIIRKSIEEEKKDTKAPGKTKEEVSTVYVGAPSMGPGFRVPWPLSMPSTSSMITNPSYLQHIQRCHYCSGYNNIICANCGRGYNY